MTMHRESIRYILTDWAFWIAIGVVLVWLKTGLVPGSVEGWKEGVEGLH